MKTTVLTPGQKAAKTRKENALYRKRSAAALKAWNTRRKNKAAEERLAKKRSDAAYKAAATRKENERAKKRSEAAYKAWITRKNTL